MHKRFMILNGANLNLLGEREPEHYGYTTLAAIEQSCRDYGKILGVEIDFRQTNHEGVLVDSIHEARKTSDVIVINPAGFSFKSIPVLDALKTYDNPIFEVHISNIHARDIHHKHSILSEVSTGVICGLGPYGYMVGMQAAAQKLGILPDSFPDPIRVGPQ